MKPIPALTLTFLAAGIPCVCRAEKLPAQPFSLRLPTRIVFEVEDGEVTAPFKMVEDRIASGGRSVLLKEGSNRYLRPGKDFFDGAVTFRFLVEKEADYVLWLRKLWMGGCGDSVYIVIDKPVTKQNVCVLLKDGKPLESFYWDKLGGHPVHLTKGEHTLVVQNREDGIKLDQIALYEFEKDRLQEDQYVPVAAEKPTKSLVK